MKYLTIYEYELLGLKDGQRRNEINRQLKEKGFDLDKDYTEFYNPRDNALEFQQ